MAWIFSVELEDFHRRLDCGLSRSPTVNVIPTLKRSLCPECKEDICRVLRSGIGLRLCVLRNLSVLAPSISFTEASRVRTLALREMGKAWRVSEVDLFPRYSASSENALPSLYSSKMCQQLELAERNQFVKNWPAKGMIAGGMLYRLQKSELHTLEKDGFFWPTPNATESGRTLAQFQENKTRGTKGGMGLSIAVQMYPTPSASNYGTNLGGAAGRKGKVRPSLETMARKNLWPTPLAREGRKGNANRKHADGSHTLSSAVGGKLNPTWVEWLMGYPSGWTELEGWATQWFLSKRGKRSKD